jgi:predicted CXXCH cytochrome family protein
MILPARHPRTPIVLLTLAVLALGARTLAAQETCASAQCHAALIQKKTVHAATESCTGCHEEVSAAHPQKGKKTFKLSAEPPDLCSACHDAFGKKSHVHAPVKEGQCTLCHDPHASDQPKLLTAPAGELCAGCHADKTEFKVMHGPASTGDCTSCHTPHESDAAALVSKPGAQLCQECHTEFLQVLAKKVVHGALADGCTTCHNPHGSANAKLLLTAGAALCASCHADVGEQVEQAKVAHPVVASEKGCASCHSPHASDHEKLLENTEKDTCIGCHKSVITKAMTTLHGPIAEGRCSGCHAPHGGANAKLLVKAFPSESYVAYTGGEFALCFGCHKRELLQHEQTSFATGFRDGERNLHFLHVNNAQKGRSCVLCHALHGSANPKLIADSVPFGAWSLPIKFSKTETGGSCAPGCHKAQAYDRQNPGQPVKAAAPSQRRSN